MRSYGVLRVALIVFFLLTGLIDLFGIAWKYSVPVIGLAALFVAAVLAFDRDGRL